jgi:hypothetical protein
VKLTAQEYKLLSYLMHHKGKVVSRTELIEHIYDQDFDRDSNTIEVFVTRIRKKLGPMSSPRSAASAIRWKSRGLNAGRRHADRPPAVSSLKARAALRRSARPPARSPGA